MHNCVQRIDGTPTQFQSEIPINYEGLSMATSHPYISGAGNVTQMIQHLRKNFPANVTSETVKKLGLASNNESYVINALQFIGLIDEEGKKTEKGAEVLVHGNDTFAKAFKELLQDAYVDLFELHGEDMWKLDRAGLVNYFRKADKTSEPIGGRQAALFRAFAGLAGYGENAEPKASKGKMKTPRAAKAKTRTRAQAAEGLVEVDEEEEENEGAGGNTKNRNKMALTVRIEINLPAGGTKENYDDIFKSIKANLLNE